MNGEEGEGEGALIWKRALEKKGILFNYLIFKCKRKNVDIDLRDLKGESDAFVWTLN